MTCVRHFRARADVAMLGYDQEGDSRVYIDSTISKHDLVAVKLQEEGDCVEDSTKGGRDTFRAISADRQAVQVSRLEFRSN